MSEMSNLKEFTVDSSANTPNVSLAADTGFSSSDRNTSSVIILILEP
jgi:hypothetical protein